ncbi:major facilitator superfamily domain-containing protein [Lactarius quietus]|nr:major facilitator superfamily domain-containing protein [Lactarius quietus]
MYMIFQGISGSARTYAIGAGIISDISTRAERAGFVGLYGLGPLVGPTLGPVIGGVLAQSFAGALPHAVSGTFLYSLRFLPETLHSIAGGGSVQQDTSDLPPRDKLTNPFKMFMYPDVLILLFLDGTYYAVFYDLRGDLFLSNPNECWVEFPAIGGGMFMGTMLSGKLMDAHYRKIRDNHNPQAHTEPKKAIDRDSGASSFPIEQVRPQLMPYLIVVYTTCLLVTVGLSSEDFHCGAFGLAVHNVMNAITSLLVDLVPKQGPSITACNDVVRCLMGAGMVTIINPIITTMGNGWAYFLLGGFSVLVAPLIWVEVRWGPIWRERRLRAQEQAVTPPSS